VEAAFEILDRGEGDRMDEDIELSPAAVDLREERRDLFLL